MSLLLSVTTPVTCPLKTPRFRSLYSIISKPMSIKTADAAPCTFAVLKALIIFHSFFIAFDSALHVAKNARENNDRNKIRKINPTVHGLFLPDRTAKTIFPVKIQARKERMIRIKIVWPTTPISLLAFVELGWGWLVVPFRVSSGGFSTSDNV